MDPDTVPPEEPLSAEDLEETAGGGDAEGNEGKKTAGQLTLLCCIGH